MLLFFLTETIQIILSQPIELHYYINISITSLTWGDCSSNFSIYVHLCVELFSLSKNIGVVDYCVGMYMGQM